MYEEKVSISKNDYQQELINIKMRYHCVIGLNTIKLSSGKMIYCCLCGSIAKHITFVNRKIFDEIHFK
jgi:hypothetical protein